MRTTAELREGFLSFFEERGHLRCPSYSLVPRAGDDSTLLTSAGMQPQMPFFLGLEPPPAPLTTTSQKVFRTVDIDEVGLDGHHLTFFEMLGNFSFGQYFKEGAIAFATEFVQEQMKLDWDRVWVTVHAGDAADEARPRRGRDRPLDEDRDAARAHRAASDLGELLVGRRAGAVRAGLRDLLGLGRGARLRRAGLRARMPALRPLPRVLEPRLHGVRAPGRRNRDAASRAEHRHRARPRARRRDPAGRPHGVRDRRLSADHELDRRRVRRRLRRLAVCDEGAPHPRRPRSRHDLPRRRRRHAVERGPRLRPAPDHQARRAAGAAHRPARRPSPLRRRRRADGRRVSGASAAGRRDRARASRWRRSASSRRSSAASSCSRSSARRARSRASRRSRSRRRTASRSS